MQRRLQAVVRFRGRRQQKLKEDREQFEREKEEYHNSLDQQICELADREESVNARGFDLLDRENAVGDR